MNVGPNIFIGVWRPVKDDIGGKIRSNGLIEERYTVGG
jgi:hypothetical protein